MLEMDLRQVISFADQHFVLAPVTTRFYLGEKTGRGISCEVCEGTDYLGNDVVIKKFVQDLSDNEIWRRVAVFTKLCNASPYNTFRIMGIYRSTDGDDTFLIQERGIGCIYTIENCPSLSLYDELACAESLLRTLVRMYQTGYLILDLKPSNLFKVSGKNEIMLFDLDSAVRCTSITDDLHFINRRYLGHEAKDTGYPIGVYSCVHAVCLILYERLFHRFPHKYELRKNRDLADQIRVMQKMNVNEAEGLDAEACTALYSMFCKELNYFPSERAGSFEEFLDEIVKLKKLIRKKEITSQIARQYNIRMDRRTAAHVHLIYRILDEHPVYQYYPEKDYLNILITGNNTDLCRIVLKCVLSCIQMLNRKIHIFLASEQARQLWYLVTDFCPDLKTSTVVYLDGVLENNYIDRTLVEHEIAYIHLISDSSINGIGSLNKEWDIRYFFSLDKNESKNLDRMKFLMEKHRPSFLAYLGEHEFNTREIDSFMIPRHPEKDLKTVIFSSYLYRNALQIHNFYSKKLDDRGRKLREAEFMNSPYNIESSERCYVNMRYKLKSIGLEMEESDAAEKFRALVLENTGEEPDRSRLEQLAWLEHFSWTAYMITSGFTKAGLDEMKEYAYKRGNDWKKTEDYPQIKHPCMVSSRIGRKITDSSWDEKDLSSYDELDKVSICFHRICKEIAMDRYDEIMRSLSRLSAVSHSDRKETEKLERLTKACFSFDKNSIQEWNAAMTAFAEVCIDSGEESKTEEIKTLMALMQPVVEASKKRDFKDNDVELVRAIPVLLSIL